MRIALPSPYEKVPEGLERVKQVYKWWSRVRKPCEKPYLSMEVTTESKVADTAGSTATPHSELLIYSYRMSGSYMVSHATLSPIMVLNS
jgi:hypothetical protein